MRSVLLHLGYWFLQIWRCGAAVREFGIAVVKANISTLIRVGFASMPPERFFETTENIFSFPLFEDYTE